MLYIKEIVDGFKINPDKIPILHWSLLSKIIQGSSADWDQLKPFIQFKNENSVLKNRFYNVVVTFTPEEIKQLLKFTTGLERIPSGASDFRFFVKFEGNTSRLPVSHTCFFEIDIPPYEMDEKLKKFIIIAISSCGTMENN